MDELMPLVGSCAWISAAGGWGRGGRCLADAGVGNKDGGMVDGLVREGGKGFDGAVDCWF